MGCGASSSAKLPSDPSTKPVLDEDSKNPGTKAGKASDSTKPNAPSSAKDMVGILLLSNELKELCACD